VRNIQVLEFESRPELTQKLANEVRFFKISDSGGAFTAWLKL